MSTLTITNPTFVNGAASDANAVNQNYTDIVTYVNAQCIVADAALSFTAIPAGPATDPTSANQFARKAYTDVNKITSVNDFYTPPGGGIDQTQLSSIQINDPGYDINVWGVGSALFIPATAGLAAVSNVWELRSKYAPANGGAYVDMAGTRVAVVDSVTVQVVTKSTLLRTGTYGGYIQFLLWVHNIANTQTTINFTGASDARYYWSLVQWRAA